MVCAGVIRIRTYNGGNVPGRREDGRTEMVIGGLRQTIDNPVTDITPTMPGILLRQLNTHSLMRFKRNKKKSDTQYSEIIQKSVIQSYILLRSETKIILHNYCFYTNKITQWVKGSFLELIL